MGPYNPRVRRAGSGGLLREATPVARPASPPLAEGGRRAPRPMGLGLKKRMDEKHFPIALYPNVHSSKLKNVCGVRNPEIDGNVLKNRQKKQIRQLCV